MLVFIGEECALQQNRTTDIAGQASTRWFRNAYPTYFAALPRQADTVGGRSPEDIMLKGKSFDFRPSCLARQLGKARLD